MHSETYINLSETRIATLLGMNDKMQYLASASISFSIWSSDPTLVDSNIFIRAHPKAPVSRLLQFVHLQLAQRGVTSLQSVDQYQLSYRNGPLSLNTLLENIEPHYSGVIRLQLDLRGPHAENMASNLDYDQESDFLTTNVEFQVNTLSIDKIHSAMESNVSLNTTLSKLKKMAIHLLNDYENHNPKNICSIKNHQPKDLVGFNIAGKLHPMSISEDVGDTHNDLRLRDLLGFDFSPSNSSYCSVMFKVRHGQGIDDDDAITIEFISDAMLNMNKMKVTPDTTVEDVKEFLCSVYAHALRLTPVDIKLIYKGQLLHDNNYAGSPSKILEYISESTGAKVHVHINQEYTEPGPGFWSELFNSPDRFSFMPTRTESTNSNSSETRNSTGATEPRTQDESLHVNDPNLAAISDIRKDYEYITESGSVVERTGQNYEKVIIDGKACFIRPHVFEPVECNIQIANKLIPISYKDYKLHQGVAFLSPQVVEQMTRETGLEFQKTDIRLELPPENSNIAQNRDTVVVEENQRITRIKQWLETIMKTIYLTLRNSVLPFIVLLQVSSFIPTHFTITGVMLVILRTLWSTGEIWDMWRELLSNGEEQRLSEEEVRNLQHVIDHKLTKQFYSKFSCNIAIKTELINQLQSNEALRERIIEEYKLERSESLQILVPQLLERCTSTQFDEISQESLDILFEPLVTQVRNHIHDIPALDESGKEFLNLLRNHVYQMTQLPWYKNIVRWINIHRPWEVIENVYNGDLMRLLITEPERDSVLTGILKNVALFFMLFWPKFQTEFEEIIAERSQRREEQLQGQPQQPVVDTQEVEEEEVNIPNTQNDVATGVERYG